MTKSVYVHFEIVRELFGSATEFRYLLICIAKCTTDNLRTGNVFICVICSSIFCCIDSVYWLVLV